MICYSNIVYVFLSYVFRLNGQTRTRDTAYTNINHLKLSLTSLARYSLYDYYCLLF